MTTNSVTAAPYVPEISDIEGSFFTDIEAQLAAMTKPTGKGSSEKAAILSDSDAANFAGQLGSVLKAKVFNSGDLAFLQKSFDSEKNSASFDFKTVLDRANLYGRDFELTPSNVAPKAGSTNVDVTVNINGGGNSPGTGSAAGSSNKPLSPLADDIYGAIQSMSNKAAGFRRGIETGDINQYSIGTAAKPGAYAKLLADAAAGRGIVVDETTSRTDILKASVEVLTRMLQDYKDEVDNA